MERFSINNSKNIDSFFLFFSFQFDLCNHSIHFSSRIHFFLSFLLISNWIFVSTISVYERQNNRYEYHDTLTILRLLAYIYVSPSCRTMSLQRNIPIQYIHTFQYICSAHNQQNENSLLLCGSLYSISNLLPPVSKFVIKADKFQSVAHGTMLHTAIELSVYGYYHFHWLCFPATLCGTGSRERRTGKAIDLKTSKLFQKVRLNRSIISMVRWCRRVYAYVMA